MTLNCVKLGRAVTFMKYLASVVSLISLAKTLIWNKITFPASNSLNLAELVVNEPMKNIYQKNYHYSFFFSIYHVKISRAYDERTRYLKKIIIGIVFD